MDANELEWDAWGSSSTIRVYSRALAVLPWHRKLVLFDLSSIALLDI